MAGRIILRRKLIKYMGFVLISKDWIKDLRQWIGKRKCLELMAGTGSLTYCLKMEGINIKGTDNYSWKRDTNGQDRSLWNEKQMWTFLENLDAEESLEKYGRDVEIVIMSWPPYNEEIAVRVLRKMRQINPSCLMIYIGEEKGGCTANDEFFDELYKIEDESFTLANRKFQNWSLTKDQVFLIK